MMLGIIKASFLGVEIPLREGSTFDLGGVVNTAQVVGTRVVNSQKMVPSEAKLKVSLEQGTVITDLFPAGATGELQIRCDSGQTFVWENAFRTDKLSVSSGENSNVDVTMAGGTPLELVQS